MWVMLILKPIGFVFKSLFRGLLMLFKLILAVLKALFNLVVFIIKLPFKLLAMPFKKLKQKQVQEELDFEDESEEYYYEFD
jgi:hypothetical protein